MWPFKTNDQAKGKADDKHDHVPPPRRFLVVFIYVFVMTVAEDAFACTLPSCDDVSTPEKDDMG